MEVLSVPASVPVLSLEQIQERLRGCPRLPSLGRINTVLRELLDAEQCYTAQIADVIRRDPSMTTRLLRLVNSVYYGLSVPVSSIEEAVFYLGVRQVRQLAVATPVIEDLQRLAPGSSLPWREFWRHCIATALLTRALLDEVKPASEEGDYVAGLLHDVGKIVMAAAFPAQFDAIQLRLQGGGCPLRTIEAETLGIDHCELGALYLRTHKIPEVATEAVRHHHQPELAGKHGQIVAAVQVADLLARHAQIGDCGDPAPISAKEWLAASGWQMLFPADERTRGLARANLERTLERLSITLEGLV